MRLFNGGVKGNRKFIVAMTALVMGCGLALLGSLSGSEFVTLAGLVVGLFGGANAVVHATGGEKE